MEIRSLEATPLSEIVTAFNAAFADYFVPVAASETAMQERWQAARVNYHLSFGAFHLEQLVGFIITGEDLLEGKKTAYNAGTGVIPEFRGQKLVEQLYAKALPQFQNSGIQQCTLEVITQNQKAIKAYQNVGFEITRTLHCFRGNLQDLSASLKPHDFRVTRVKNFHPEPYKAIPSPDFSWDYLNEGVQIQKKNLEAWNLSKNGELVGYVLLNPVSGLLFQLGFNQEVLPQGGQVLFSALAREIPAVRINNVDGQAPEIIRVLQMAGLENHVDQYEMLLQLN